MILRTEGTVALLSGSSMTGIDAVAGGCIRPDEAVLVIRHGRFGDRLADCSAVHGAEVHSLSVPWGQCVTPDMFRNHLIGVLSRGPLRAVWMVHSETSTGVSLDVQAFSKILREHSPETLLLVDAVTSAAIQELRMDAWHIDAVIAGAQKGLMSPPGVAIVALSARCEEIVRNSVSGQYSNDLKRTLQVHDKGLMLWTPPVGIVRALAEATDMISEEGLENTWKRHDELHAFVTQQATIRGIEIFGQATSRALVAVTRNDVSELRLKLRQRFQMHVADGQDELSGKIMRIGICGSYSISDMQELFEAIDAIDAGQAPRGAM